uniref:Uncharacterized protein n=1 Tax=Zooxanthella nutricula TaxID=1333877 RepID=A0A7S2JDY1_9DINO
MTAKTAADFASSSAGLYDKMNNVMNCHGGVTAEGLVEQDVSGTFEDSTAVSCDGMRPRRGPRCYKFVQPEVRTQRMLSLKACSLRAVLPLVRAARAQRLNDLLPHVPPSDPALLQLYVDSMREDAEYFDSDDPGAWQLWESSSMASDDEV